MNGRTRERFERRAQGGFTLVELTVALLAGLIVGLGIMTLSKEATRTFNEEMRGSAAEATLRTAVDRLRDDLQRAAFMSTGNIMSDTAIAKSPSATTNVTAIGAGMKGLLGLASIKLTPGGSAAQTPLSALQTPALTPDLFEIGGNMTTSEQFEVQMISPTSTSCTQILLSQFSPAIYRIAATGLGTPAATEELLHAFKPVTDSLATQFIVRLVDTTGHTQYLATCPRADVAGFNGVQPYVWIDSVNTPIQTASQTGTQGGAAGYCVGCVINPIQVVRWEITSATQEQTSQAQYAAALGQQPLAYGNGTVDAAKYDLMRTYMDATDTAVLSSSEVIAEYAVDLKLAFSVDTTTLGDVSPSITTYAFEDPNNARWAVDVSTALPTPNFGPQRIRSVRARVVTRASQPDRVMNIPVTNFGAQEYVYRYCVNSTPSCATNDGTPRWSRARTLTTEVSLPNQSMDFF